MEEKKTTVTNLTLLCTFISLDDEE